MEELENLAQLSPLVDGEEALKAVVDETRNFFNGLTNYEFDKVLGAGAFGIAFRVIEKHPRDADGRYRRLAVKRAWSTTEQEDLISEIRTIRGLQGAMHIARYIAGTTAPVASRAEATSDSPRSAKRIRIHIGGRTENKFLSGLQGPVLIMEYLNNHTFSYIISRAVEMNAHLPNRILWSFFLCLVRACVALAYPPGVREGQPAALETIPDDGQEPAGLIHNDLNLGNIIVGDVSPEIPEHSLVPVVKLIDFGAAYQHGRGSSRNLFDISVAMLYLIARGMPSPLPQAEYDGAKTEAGEIVPDGGGANYPTLDHDLRDLLARCLSVDSKRRPDLRTMLEETQRGAAKTADAYAPHQKLETEDVIRATLERLVLSAEEVPADAVTNDGFVALGKAAAAKGDAMDTVGDATNTTGDTMDTTTGG
ncbi:hypothetical protein F5Y15DRAFT_424613 [Xylariaceae sp. FL0016]|nr:hypothetical protein F5Y15DRAFT_424613 [Xylariaceae sp. FL0016]